MSEFQGNSHADRKARSPEKKEQRPAKQVNRVISDGAVVRRKRQPMSKRLKAHFMPETDLPLPEHIFFEVLMPGAMAAAAEVFHQSIDILLPTRGGARFRGGGAPRRGSVEYRRPQGRGNVPWDREDPRDAGLSRRARATHSFDQLILDDRYEAERVLDEMANLLADYDQVTVGDYYDCVGETKEFTDENYGWTSLVGTRVLRRDGGYVIDLPPTESLTRNR